MLAPFLPRRTAGNAQFLHFVDQGGALETESGGCAFWATDHPSDCVEGLQNQSAFGVSRRVVGAERGMSGKISAEGKRLGSTP